MKEIIKLRMRVKDINNVTLCEMETYGVLMDTMTIMAEGRIFKAGRKTGFGKSNYIYENKNGRCHKVIIDKMERISEEA